MSYFIFTKNQTVAFFILSDHLCHLNRPFSLLTFNIITVDMHGANLATYFALSICLTYSVFFVETLYFFAEILYYFICFMYFCNCLWIIFMMVALKFLSGNLSFLSSQCWYLFLVFFHSVPGSWYGEWSSIETLTLWIL